MEKLNYEQLYSDACVRLYELQDRNEELEKERDELMSRVNDATDLMFEWMRKEGYFAGYVKAMEYCIENLFTPIVRLVK